MTKPGEKVDNTNEQNNKISRAPKSGFWHKARTLSLGLLTALNVAAFDGTPDIKEDLYTNLSTEMPYENGSLENLNIRNRLITDSKKLPTKLKSLYRKLASIKNREDLKNLRLGQRDMYFLIGGQFMNPDWVTKPLWKKASKNLIKIFSGFRKSDLKSFYKDYKEKNPWQKMSKSDFDVLSQPITAETFSIRANVDGLDYPINALYEESWYLVSIPKGSLFMFKYSGRDRKWKQKEYEPWLFYSDAWENKVKSIPILIDWLWTWNIEVKDINWRPLDWWCGIWTDGNLYEIDAYWKFVRKDWKKYSLKDNKDKIVFSRNYAFKDLNTWDWKDYIAFNVSVSNEKLYADKHEQKKSRLPLRFKETELQNYWYTITISDNDKEVLLKRDNVTASVTYDIVWITKEQFQERVASAKLKVDEQLDQIEAYKIQYNNKEKVYEEVVRKFCVVDTTKSFDMNWVYPLSWRKIRELSWFKNSYGIKKRESLRDEEPAYLVIVNMETGEELAGSRFLTSITDKYGQRDKSDFEVESDIVTRLKKVENERSFIDFLKLIVVPKSGWWEINYNTYANSVVNYKWYYLSVERLYGTRRKERDYVIIVSKQKGVYRGDGIVTLTINKDMTGHDIKELVDKTIAEMN